MDMHVRTKTPWPSASGLWSLLWRSFLLAPFAMVFGVFWLITRPLLVILPFYEVYLLTEKSWLPASITPLVWIMLFLLTRSSWFKADRRDFPNDQENV